MKAAHPPQAVAALRARPADNIHICKEDDRCRSVAKLYGVDAGTHSEKLSLWCCDSKRNSALTFENVDAALLVQKNKRKWPKLNQTAPLKEGTDLVLPLPGDAHEHTCTCSNTRK